MKPNDLSPIVVDLHYDILKGVGWQNDEIGGEICRSITHYANKGSKAIFVNDSAGFVSGQLVVVVSSDLHDTNVIDTIQGNEIKFKYRLQNHLFSGDLLCNFYANPTHPNTQGYNAIADKSIDLISNYKIGEKLFKILPQDGRYAGSGTFSDGGFVQNYTQPFAVFDTKILTNTRQLVYEFNLEKDTAIVIKSYFQTTEDAIVNIQISDVNNTKVFYNKNYQNLANGNTDFLETALFLRQGFYNFKIRNIAQDKRIIIGKNEIFKLGKINDIECLNSGKHLLLGDSWFEMSGIEERLSQKLPYAAFINFGVGGNRSENILRRFNGTASITDIKNDLVKYKNRLDATLIDEIDYVWVMVGTNDYNNAIEDAIYKRNLDLLVNEILNKQAKPILFNSSVGCVETSNNFTLSRQYADLTY